MQLRRLKTLVLTLGLSLAASAEPAGSRMVDLLGEATLVSSRSDCRFGVYRCAARNEKYLNAVLTGLKASGVKGVDKPMPARQRELALLALYAETFSGDTEDAIKAGQAMLAGAEEQQPWVRLALLEAARQGWRSDIMQAQLKALAASPPAQPVARFLAESFAAEGRARQQPPDWSSALAWHEKTWSLLDGQAEWPVGSGHFLTQALAAWEEILLDAAQSEDQRIQALALLDRDQGRFQPSDDQGVNPELFQASLFEWLSRLAELRRHDQWEAAGRQLPALEIQLERLSRISKAQAQADLDRMDQLGAAVTQLGASDKDLGGRGLELMPGNLRPSDVTSGELSRLQGAYYKERARLLLCQPDDPQRLEEARKCLEVSAIQQMMTILTQSPLATVDPPVFDMVELELRQKSPGWQDRVRKLADQSVDFFERYSSKPGLVASLACQGEARLACGDQAGARAALTRAVELAERHVSELGYTGSWAARFRQRFSKAYELLLGLEMQAGNSEAAANLLSRFQQLQLAQLRQTSLVGRAGGPLLRLRGGPITGELPPAPAKAGGNGAVTTVAQGKGEFFQALGTLRQRHPEYEKLLAVRPVNYAQLQKWIPNDTAVVQYFPASDGLYIFWVTAKDFKIHKLNVSSDELKNRVWKFRKSMVGDFIRSGCKGPLEPAQTASQALYSVLVKPLEADLAAFQTVAFVPTTYLSYVPFAALGETGGDGRFHYLIESKACLSLLKSSDLELLSQPAANSAGALLALGNPDGSLPAASLEAEKVAELFQNSKSYVGSEASRDKLDKLAPGTRVLHLATHGCLDSNNPSQSYLVLGGKARLSVADIYALSLPDMRLVTLSACETGLGQTDPGSEVASLADAFEIAGARTVIASLWSVEDNATQKLMLAFYGELKQGRSLAQSLRQAQLGLLADPQSQAPFFWAPFSIYGDWR
jgi:CHAT domain-containing protein